MKIALLSILALLVAAPAHALPEADLASATNLLNATDGFFTNATIAASDGVTVSYTRFGTAEIGPQGCLVLVPGQGEPALKYVEVAHDLAAAGFGPIYAIDHRGQGFSGRLLEDPQKNTVGNFDDYVNDFETFVNTVVLGSAGCAKPNVLAHSMGGAVMVAYLEKLGTSSPFHRVVMSSPMLKILYPAPRTESSVIWETFFACNSPFGPHCDDYAPRGGPLNIEAPFASNVLTHSEARFNFKNEMYRHYPTLIVGSPTVRWVRQAALADQEMRRIPNVQRIAADLLLLEAGEDKLVDRASEDDFCASLGPRCQAVPYLNAFHEIFMESDPIRDDAMARAIAFLSE